MLCQPPTLIPRPETAYIFAKFAERYLSGKNLRLLDLYTGSGAIPILLTHLVPGLQSVGVDIQPSAIRLAGKNVEYVGVNSSPIFSSENSAVSPSITFLEADITAPEFPGRFIQQFGTFDTITANPPYISPSAILPASVQEYEDPLALTGGAGLDGLEHYRHLARITPLLLSDTSERIVAMEIGYDQSAAVTELFRVQSTHVETVQDQWGRDRMVIARVSNA